MDDVAGPALADRHVERVELDGNEITAALTLLKTLPLGPSRGA